MNIKVGDLVRHIDIPKECRIVGVVVEAYVDLNTCEVIWIDRDLERFMHCPGSLEVISATV